MKFKNFKEDMKAIFCLLGIVLVGFLILSIFIGNPIFRWVTRDDDIVVIVKDKERVVTTGEHAQSYYLVYGDKETFTVRDDWWNGRFAASDTYGKLEDGKTFKVRVTGWRWPLFSWYRNILDVEPISQ